MLPMVRDPDGGVYFREWGGGLCTGGFEQLAKPCFHEGTPKNFEFQLLPENWVQFEVLIDEILHRFPVLEEMEILQMINGPESFTPDTKYIVGEAPNQVETLYSRILSTGEEYGIRNIGLYALNNIRIEKGLPVIGEELVPSTTPYDVGLDSLIDFNKAFIGKKALLNLEDKPSGKRLVHLVMEQHDNECIPWGGETIVHNGDIIGEVTSSAFNFKLGHPVCLGFIEKKDEIVDENLDINIAGTLYPVKVVTGH